MKTALKKSQVIACRIDFKDYDRLEIKCIEDGKKISHVLKQAVREYLTKKN